MSEAWIKVYSNGNLTCTVPLDRPFELGRQQNRQEPLYSPRYIETEGRLVVAPEPLVSIPRRLLRLQPLAGGVVRISNIHVSAIITIDGGPSVRPGASFDARPGCLLTLGDGVAVRIEEPLELSAVGTPSLAPSMGVEAIRNGTLNPCESPDPAKLIQWFQAVIFILQSATTSKDLFHHSVDALVRLVGMDNGAVVLWDAQAAAWSTKEWQCTTGTREGADEWVPSQQILTATRGSGKVLFHVPTGMSQSLEQVRGVVAAPILAEDGTVLGVLYGDRRSDLANRPQISQLDAQLVQTIACSITTGLVRLEREQRVVAEHTRFEQFFSAELARALTADPSLLEGRDADVTCLFCDIRGFSRVSEKLGAKQVMEWIQVVLGVLSDCVQAEKGVLIDYIGDELFAMWGAPEQQADHAARACAAAQAMLKCMPGLNAEWGARLGCGEFSVGIGIHSGTAHVGNSGSKFKFKYGPLGNTVNLASRVQGATKYLRSNLLVTQHTRARFPECDDFRRLCKIRVVNIVEPIELFDLPAVVDASWRSLKASYDLALTAFEAHDYRGAMRRLIECLEVVPDDGPSILLLSRSVTALGEAPTDTAWVLPGK
jgi:adenylate cyclase